MLPHPGRLHRPWASVCVHPRSSADHVGNHKNRQNQKYDVAAPRRRSDVLRGRLAQMPVVRVGLGAKIVFWDGKATTIGHLCAPFA